MQSMKPTEPLPGTQRIEAFSDGVLAIVITLMVLEIKVPLLAESATDAEALQKLGTLVPKFLAYLLSFVMIAIFWVNHHQFFHSLRRSDRTLLWLNNHLLFWLCLIPFPTAFLGEHPSLKTAVAFFAILMFMAALSFYILRRYAMRRPELLLASLSASVVRKSLRRSLVAPVLYFVAILSTWASVYIAYAIFISVPLLFFLPINHSTEPTHE